MAHYSVVEGTTTNIKFQLLENGVPVNLTNITTTLILTDRTGTTVTSPGTISIDDITNGKVSLIPTSASVFVASKSPYSARWQLTDIAGKVCFVPSGNRDLWTIVGR